MSFDNLLWNFISVPVFWGGNFSPCPVLSAWRSWCWDSSSSPPRPPESPPPWLLLRRRECRAASRCQSRTSCLPDGQNGDCSVAMLDNYRAIGIHRVKRWIYWRNLLTRTTRNITFSWQRGLSKNQEFQPKILLLMDFFQGWQGLPHWTWGRNLRRIMKHWSWWQLRTGPTVPRSPSACSQSPEGGESRSSEAGKKKMSAASTASTAPTEAKRHGFQPIWGSKPTVCLLPRRCRRSHRWIP